MYHRNFLTFRFFVGHVDPRYERFIQHENSLHGDIISLPWVDDTSAAVVNSIKPAECFEYLVQNDMYHTFVSKLDDDAFLNVPGFWHDYLSPRLQTPGGSYLIARNDTQGVRRPYVVPGGQFYTLTWDLVQALVDEYPRHPRLEYMEAGPHTGFLLAQSGSDFEFVQLDNDVAFDYDARGRDPRAWSHRVMEGAINPHRMQWDEEYLEVASYFDEQGLNMEMIRGEMEEERRVQAEAEVGRQTYADTGRQGQVDSGRQGQLDSGRTTQDSDRPVQVDSGRTHAQVDSGRTHAQVDSGRGQSQVDNTGRR